MFLGYISVKSVCLILSSVMGDWAEFFHPASGVCVFQYMHPNHNPNTFSLSSLSSLSHLKLTSSKVVVPPGIDPGTPRTPIPWTPMPSHTCNAARPAIPYLYRPCIDDVVGLTPIFTFPTVVFCEIQWG